jgi:hypothetical protein
MCTECDFDEHVFKFTSLDADDQVVPRIFQAFEPTAWCVKSASEDPDIQYIFSFKENARRKIFGSWISLALTAKWDDDLPRLVCVRVDIRCA